MIIGITGMPGSGKTEVSKDLEAEGFVCIEMGKVVYEMMKERKLKITPESVPVFATNIRKRRGKAFIAKEITKRIRGKAYGSKIAIIGIRSPHEIEYFRRKLGEFTVIGVVAPKRTRFERLKRRSRRDDPMEISGFEFREKKEKGYGIIKAIAEADYIITNTGNRTQLRGDIIHVIESICK